MPFRYLHSVVNSFAVVFFLALLSISAVAQTSQDAPASQDAPVAQEAPAGANPNGASKFAPELNWPSAWKSEVDSADGNEDKKQDTKTDAKPKTETSQAETPSPAKPAATPEAQTATTNGAASTTGTSTNAASPQASPSEPVNTTPQPAEAPPVTEPSNTTTPAKPNGATPATTAAPATAPAATPPATESGATTSPPAASAPVATAPATPAKPVEPVELNNSVSKLIETSKGLADRLSSLEKTVERVKDRDEELTQQLPPTEKILAEAEATATQLAPPLADIRSQIDKLGPAPEAGKTESEKIAAERQRLTATANEIDGAIKTAELTQVRARQLAARIQTLRLDSFRRSMFHRSPSLFSPGLWKDAILEVPRAFRQLNSIFKNWLVRVQQQWVNVLAVFGVALLVGLFLQMLSRRSRRLLREESPDGPPSFFRRTMVASIEAPLRMLPKIAAAAVVYVGFETLGLLYLQISGLAVAAYKSVAIIAAGTAYTTAYLQPARPEWRVIKVGDEAAWKLRRVIRLTIFLFSIDLLARSAISELYLPLSGNIVWTSVACVLFAIIFYRAVRVPIVMPEGAGPRLTFFVQNAHKFPLILTIAVIVISLLTGYVALAHFVSTQMLIIAAAVFLLVTFYIANRAIAVEPDQNKYATIPGAHTIPIEVRRKLARGLSIVLDVILFLIAIPIMLLAVGFAPAEISTLTNRALFGFEVGGVEISLAKIGVAVGLAVSILFLSRMLQRWLGETILHPSRTEQGLGNSIRTGVGYIGFIVAVLAGLSYAGLDITNLAIVAGALSVGIGFGLQSIVNNFVSGLILLVERPINVGDWIKVADTQGHVRRISVRSTEIETFERASVIIPNSELISGTVTNMTLRNALGRITIPVGVSYSSDPDLVHKLLMEAAEESDSVARHPAPFVVFENFGNSSLDFTLRIYVADVSSSLSTQTDVRKRILKKFREHKIEIPFPQRDLNIRSVDGASKKTLSDLATSGHEDPFDSGDEIGSTSSDAPQGET